ncbi:hypothetical protein, partial [Mesorhizobium sp. M1A.F.Ca.IN.020.32.1.1]|uniref:hypothetical protein n=1 Tax=Mesorhizobium sp. M1A.F.Ca.IN.020.32.1.1 TaxID=2496763 RepID=UPI001FE130AF
EEQSDGDNRRGSEVSVFRVSQRGIAQWPPGQPKDEIGQMKPALANKTPGTGGAAPFTVSSSAAMRRS